MNIFLISLGCDKNSADSGAMLGILMDKGYRIATTEKEADVIIINTCCFIHDAKEESIETILEMSKLKSTGRLKKLIVTGCLAQRYKEEIIKEIPEVDALLGTTAYDEIINAIEENKSFFRDINYLPKIKSKKVVETATFTSYIKISEGCDKFCTYCIIPKLRGRHRSISMEELISEAEYLASQGTKELVVIAQDTTIYGTDLYGEKTLPKLLKEFCKIDGLEWIRLLYCYPEDVTDELIQVIKEEDKICKYIDLPIQHASDKILKNMGRRTNREYLIKLINKLRSEIDDITIRTTLIVGFPGEIDEDFDILLDFVYEMNFDRLGVFTYSPEEGTPAAEMDNQIEEDVKISRRDAIMTMQQDIAYDKNIAIIGNYYDVIIEGYLEEDDVYVGRTYMDAPKIDGLVFVKCDRTLMTGDKILVEITTADAYDLEAKVVQ